MAAQGRLTRLLAHLPPATAARTGSPGAVDAGLTAAEDGGWSAISDAPAPTYIRPPRFVAGSPELAAHLDEHGYAVCKGVLKPVDCERAVSLTWDFLESVGTGIDRTDVSTWSGVAWPSPARSGFLASNGANHCAAAWAVRGAPGVKECFAGLWGTDDLLVNFDAVLAYRPWWHPLGEGEAWRAKSGFYHVDQASMHTSRFVEPAPVGDDVREYIQGAVNLITMSEHTGGHVVIPKSHRCFREVMDRHRIAERGFPVPPSEPLLATAVMPHMEAGDMLLFDSRTLQCSAPGITPGLPASAETQLLHVEVYVTMSPKALASEATLEQRRLGLAGAAPFGCHAAHHQLADPPGPAEPEPGFVVVPPPALSAEQMALVG
jgi:hypothetical protein